MGGPFEPEERVFLVRIRAVTAPSGTLWRGSVTDVIGGERLSIAAPAEVADFIATRLLAAPRGREA